MKLFATLLVLLFSLFPFLSLGLEFLLTAGATKLLVTTPAGVTILGNPTPGSLQLGPHCTTFTADQVNIINGARSLFAISQPGSSTLRCTWITAATPNCAAPVFPVQQAGGLFVLNPGTRSISVTCQ